MSENYRIEDVLSAEDMRDILWNRRIIADNLVQAVMNSAAVEAQHDITALAQAVERQERADHALAVGELEDVVGVLIGPGEEFPGSIEEAREIRRRQVQAKYGALAQMAADCDRRIATQTAWRDRDYAAMYGAAAGAAGGLGYVLWEAFRWLFIQGR